jgi:hypothetical protein
MFQISKSAVSIAPLTSEVLEPNGDSSAYTATVVSTLPAFRPRNVSRV